MRTSVAQMARVCDGREYSRAKSGRSEAEFESLRFGFEFEGAFVEVGAAEERRRQWWSEWSL